MESYRDAFELLFGYLEDHLGKRPSALTVADLDAPVILIWTSFWGRAPDGGCPSNRWKASSAAADARASASIVERSPAHLCALTR